MELVPICQRQTAHVSSEVKGIAADLLLQHWLLLKTLRTNWFVWCTTLETLATTQLDGNHIDTQSYSQLANCNTTYMYQQHNTKC